MNNLDTFINVGGWVMFFLSFLVSGSAEVLSLILAMVLLSISLGIRIERHFK